MAATAHDPQAPIAIVGMAGLFPQAPDIAAFWRNILGKVDTVAEAPDDWLSNPHFLDETPDSDDISRIYTQRGGFLRDLSRFDPRPFGIMPVSISGGEPDQFLAMRAALDALADAGYPKGAPDPERTGIILGHAIHVHRANSNGLQHTWILDQMQDLLRALAPDAGPERLAEIRRILHGRLPPIDTDSIPGLVPNMMTGRIANRLGLMGPNYIMDGACGSMLMAAEAAINELRNGHADLMLAGGVNTTTSPLVYAVFCRLGALSRTGRIRPFDRGADGTVLGEGLGIVALRRLDDALADGNRVYAVIRAVGQSSDGRGGGLMAPRLEGEVLAMRRAYQQSGLDPADIGLIEAHGTSIPLGDRTEVTALREVLGGRRDKWPTVPIGSVKSMIGHCIPAAGAAALIKTALALHHRILPPTLCDEVDPGLGLAETPLYVNTEASPWLHGQQGAPRRAAINAFGFGGVNAHMILEEAPGRYEGAAPDAAFLPTALRFPANAPGLRRPEQGELIVLAAADRDGVLAGIDALRVQAEDAAPAAVARAAWAALPPEGQRGPQRLALVARDRDDLRAKLTQARDRLAAEPGRARLKTRGGLYFSSVPLVGAGAGGKIAFLFPGENSQYPGMLRGLALAFPVVRDWLDFLQGLFSEARTESHAQLLYPPPLGLAPAERDALEARLRAVDAGSEAVFCADQALFHLLRTLGVRPDMLLGHSTGENAALVASGALDMDRPAVGRYIQGMNAIFARLEAEDTIPPATLLSIGALPRETLVEALAAHPDVTFTMDNCPNQAVVLGPRAAIGTLAGTLTEAGALCQTLPLSWAYHTPAVAPMAEGFRDLFKGVAVTPERGVPLYSCVHAAPFPVKDRDAFLQTAIDQYTSRVRFTEAVERLYADGARVFVEVGPGATLTAFVNDILRDRPKLAESVDSTRRDGVTQLLHLLAQLFVVGVDPDPAPLLGSAWPEGAPTDAPALPSVMPYVHLGPEDADRVRGLLGLGADARPEPRPVMPQPAGVRRPMARRPAGRAAARAPAPRDWTAAFTAEATAPLAVRALGGPAPSAPDAGLFAPAELDQWRASVAASGPARRADWLRGRLAAKAAVRDLLARQGRPVLAPSAIAVMTDADGAPVVRLSDGRAAPVVSLAHLSASAAGGRPLALAVAVPPGQRVGIDVEHAAHVADPAALADQALTEAERGVLAARAPAATVEGPLLLWCCKEAAAKALGVPLLGRERAIVVTALSPDLRAATVAVEDRAVPLRLTRASGGFLCALAGPLG